MTERTWEISDIDGKNKRTVTLAQYRTELDAAKKAVNPAIEAFRRGDLAAYAAALKTLRR